MNITVLALDNDSDFTYNLKILIEELNQKFFDSVKTNITKIYVKTASDTKDALFILNTEKINLLLIDIELGAGEFGHEFYETLFVNGIEIPSMALSAVVDTPKLRKEILEVGISTIVKKFKSSGRPIEERVAEAICQILNSAEQKLSQLQSNVDRYEITEKAITYNSETNTIQDWINILARNENIAGTSEIRKIIMKICTEQSKYEQRSM